MTKTARRRAGDAGLAALATGVDLGFSLARLHWQGGAESKPGTFGVLLLIVGGGALLARRRFTRGRREVVIPADRNVSGISCGPDGVSSIG